MFQPAVWTVHASQQPELLSCSELKQVLRLLFFVMPRLPPTAATTTSTTPTTPPTTTAAATTTTSSTATTTATITTTATTTTTTTTTTTPPPTPASTPTATVTTNTMLLLLACYYHCCGYRSCFKVISLSLLSASWFLLCALSFWLVAGCLRLSARELGDRLQGRCSDSIKRRARVPEALSAGLRLAQLRLCRGQGTFEEAKSVRRLTSRSGDALGASLLS